MYEVYLSVREIHAGLVMAGDSIHRIAHRCGVSPTTAYRVAQGMSGNVTLRNEIAKVLGKQVHEVFGPVRTDCTHRIYAATCTAPEAK